MKKFFCLIIILFFASKVVLGQGMSSDLPCVTNVEPYVVEGEQYCVGSVFEFRTGVEHCQDPAAAASAPPSVSGTATTETIFANSTTIRFRVTSVGYLTIASGTIANCDPNCTPIASTIHFIPPTPLTVVGGGTTCNTKLLTATGGNSNYTWTSVPSGASIVCQNGDCSQVLVTPISNTSTTFTATSTSSTCYGSIENISVSGFAVVTHAAPAPILPTPTVNITPFTTAGNCYAAVSTTAIPPAGTVFKIKNADDVLSSIPRNIYANGAYQLVLENISEPGCYTVLNNFNINLACCPVRPPAGSDLLCDFEAYYSYSGGGCSVTVSKGTIYGASTNCYIRVPSGDFPLPYTFPTPPVAGSYSIYYLPTTAPDGCVKLNTNCTVNITSCGDCPQPNRRAINPTVNVAYNYANCTATISLTPDLLGYTYYLQDVPNGRDISRPIPPSRLISTAGLGKTYYINARITALADCWTRDVPIFIKGGCGAGGSGTDDTGGSGGDPLACPSQAIGLTPDNVRVSEVNCAYSKVELNIGVSNIPGYTYYLVNSLISTDISRPLPAIVQRSTNNQPWYIRARMNGNPNCWANGSLAVIIPANNCGSQQEVIIGCSGLRRSVCAAKQKAPLYPGGMHEPYEWEINASPGAIYEIENDPAHYTSAYGAQCLFVTVFQGEVNLVATGYPLFGSETRSYTLIASPAPILTPSPTSGLTATGTNSYTTSAICAGESKILSFSGASTYTWSPATGLNTTTGNTVIASPSETTTYTVTAKNEFGCVTTATVRVEVIPAPVVSVSANTLTYCEGSSLPQVIVSGLIPSMTRTWSILSGTSPLPTQVSSTATSTTFSFNPTSAGVTQYALTVNTGCTLKSFIITVNRVSSSSMVISPTTQTITTGGSAYFDVTGGSPPYTWTSTGSGVITLLSSTADRFTFSMTGVDNSQRIINIIDQCGFAKTCTLKIAPPVPLPCGGNAAAIVVTPLECYKYRLNACNLEGYTAYWQETPSGTTLSSNTIEVTAPLGTTVTLTYYLRLRRNSDGAWSNPVSKSVSFSPVSPPPAPTLSPASTCSNRILIKPSVPSGHTIYWLGPFPSSSPPPVVTSSTVLSNTSPNLTINTAGSWLVYLVSKRDIDGCVSELTPFSVDVIGAGAILPPLEKSALTCGGVRLSFTPHVSYPISSFVYRLKLPNGSIMDLTGSWYFDLLLGSMLGTYTLEVVPLVYSTTSCGADLSTISIVGTDFSPSSRPPTPNCSYPLPNIVSNYNGVMEVALPPNPVGSAYIYVWPSSDCYYGVSTANQFIYYTPRSLTWALASAVNDCSSQCCGTTITTPINPNPRGPSYTVDNKCGRAIYTFNYPTPNTYGVTYYWQNTACSEDISSPIPLGGTITITSNGTYFVRAKNAAGFWSSCAESTINVILNTTGIPTPNLGSDLYFCMPAVPAGTVLNSGVTDPTYTYIWQYRPNSTASFVTIAGATANTLTVSNGFGEYKVIVTNPASTCVREDIVKIIKGAAPPAITLTRDCEIIKLTAQNIAGYTNYVWSDGTTGNVLYVNESGTYTVQATYVNSVDNMSCVATASITVDVSGYAVCNVALPAFQFESASIDDVISVQINTFSDRWMTQKSASALTENPYLNAQAGVWRPENSFVYVKNRSYTKDATGNYNFNLAKDGTFKLDGMFDWKMNGAAYDTAWRKINTVTRYNTYGAEIENRNILGFYSTALHGYKGQLPVAVADNARYSEIAFEGFEEYLGESITGMNNLENNFNFYTIAPLFPLPGITKTILRHYYVPYAEPEIVSGTPTARTVARFEGVTNLSGNVNIKANIIGVSQALMLTGKPINLSVAQPSAGITKLTINAPELANKKWLGTISQPQSISVRPVFSLENISVSTQKAHTGKKSLKIKNGIAIFPQKELELQPYKTYVISAWVSLEDGEKYADYSSDAPFPNLMPQIAIAFGESIPDIPLSDFIQFKPKGSIVEGWQKIEASFCVPANYGTLNIRLFSGASKTAYFDDIRLFPQDGSIKTFVYDLKNLRPTAELDPNNYATFYFYDEQGRLFLLKKETERGIFTIQESNMHQGANE